MKEQSMNTLFIGKVAIYLPTVDSTNRFAQQYISKSRPIEGTVIRADEQSEGRGQLGSKWESTPGLNITISLILRPKFLLARQQFLLSAAMALGVYDFLNMYPLPEPLSIKWPNDLYIGNKKIGGMLIENTLRGDYLNWSIIGLGININQTIFDPALPNPTSLALLLNKNTEINNCLFQLYAALERQYLRMQTGTVESIFEDYTQKLFRLQEKALYKIVEENRVVEGIIKGVDNIGRLLLFYENETKPFELKKITPIF